MSFNGCLRVMRQLVSCLCCCFCCCNFCQPCRRLCCRARSDGANSNQDGVKGSTDENNNKKKKKKKKFRSSSGRLVSFFVLLILLRVWILTRHDPTNTYRRRDELCEQLVDAQVYKNRNNDTNNSTTKRTIPIECDATVEPSESELQLKDKFKFVRQVITTGQQKRLGSEENVERYNRALNDLFGEDVLRSVDPLVPGNRNMTARLPFQPKVRYLGVMVDAGRHNFPIDWLKQLLPYLHQLRYNLLHLRLTDDQTFNLQLESYPQLAKPSPWPREKDNRVYTPKELQELVVLAKKFDIAIVPEINVPGHAGGWAGIPNLTIPCPNFICEKGYGIPLNINHPQIKTILKSVLKEVIHIFDNPPFLHLGGDEVSMSRACMEEAGLQPFEYKGFEQMLQGILKEIGYPEEQVIRWEETPQLQKSYDPSKPRPSYRAGFIEHYWHDRPGFRSDSKGDIIDLTPPNNTHFVSHKLYMDTNHDSGLSDIYSHTEKNLQLKNGPDYFPTAIVVGTFELSPEMWLQRNVAARLLVVAMGVADLRLDSSDDTLHRFYNETCYNTLGLNPSICELQGFTATTHLIFGSGWRKMWHVFKGNACERMTDKVKQRTWKDLRIHREDAFMEGSKYLWQSLSNAMSRGRETIATPKKKRSPPKHQNPRIKTGVILDLVNGMKYFNRSAQVVEQFLAPLEISMLQLRLVDNHAFVVELEHLNSVAYSIELMPTQRVPNASTDINNLVRLPNASDISELVHLATNLGMQTYPEISVSTNAGGWAFSGFVRKCPNTYCEEAEGPMAADITQEEFLPVVYAAIRELVDIFSVDSEKNTMQGLLEISSANKKGVPYFHLGSDERLSNQKCFQESGLVPPPPYVEFEQNLTRIVQDMIGVSTDRVVRWENSEGVNYPGRTGEITHYPSTHPFVVPQVRSNESFFVTVDILKPSTLFEVYKNTRKLMELNPLAVFAELRRFDEEAWEVFQVELRLTAFHMAMRMEENEIKQEGDFMKMASSDCERFGFERCKQTNSLQQISRWMSGLSDTENHFYFYESRETRARICHLFSELINRRTMKPEMIS